MTPILILLFVTATFAGDLGRKCPKGQKLECATDCGRKCEDYFNPPAEECEQIFCIWTTCVCDPGQGYYLNGTDCIRKELCPRPTTKPPAPQCPWGQEKVCDTYCNRTCTDYYSPPDKCLDIVCVTTTCMCDNKKGFYLDEKKGICVYYTQCPNPYMCN